VNEKPFDASLFVELRKRAGMDAVNSINERIVELKTHFESKEASEPEGNVPPEDDIPPPSSKGKAIFDAAACPQDIACPTDLDLLSDARHKSEELIDILYDPLLHGAPKPRTSRQAARREYLGTAQKRKKAKKQIRSALRKQPGYLGRNIRTLNHLLDAYETIHLGKKELKYFHVIQTLYEQQLVMYKTKTHRVDDRIVSIHQPHVRPIVRGKSKADVEFGARIHLPLIDGISFLDELSWDAFNEGCHPEAYIEQYRRRFGFYPAEVLADKIYCTRDNRKLLKEKGIHLKAKPLGRPSASAASIRASPGERNPVEGKSGQARTAYGLDRIRARLRETSESWIAGIILALNLVKLAGAIALCTILKVWLSFSALLENLANFDCRTANQRDFLSTVRD
jgi:hypothetical protein